MAGEEQALRDAEARVMLSEHFRFQISDLIPDFNEFQNLSEI
jgi:hypothetical protein